MPHPARPRRIGLLGGSFDPIHRAHLALAEAAREAFALDELRLMPCAQQALKTRRATSAEARCAMLRLALADHPHLTLDLRECYAAGPIYTIDTLRALRAAEPDAEFWFIVGMDSVVSFPKWRNPEELLTLCHFIAFDRPGIEPPERPFSPALLAHRLHGPLLNLSSTDLREALAAGHFPSNALPPAILPYLRAHPELYMPLA